MGAIQKSPAKYFADHTEYLCRPKLSNVIEKCVKCDLCKKECGFLQKHGSPLDIAESTNLSEDKYITAFECSLCRLCTEVCPSGADPSSMFLEMRQSAVKNGIGDFRQHNCIRDYEKRGTSERYSLYVIPEKCDTIFFPGCTLPGTRPDKTIKLYDFLKSKIKNLGVVLDCCAKPSLDLGNSKRFENLLSELKSNLKGRGIKRILVACPNCYRVFDEYGGDLKVESVYEVLSGYSPAKAASAIAPVTVHDPCAVRFDKNVQNAVRELISTQGFNIKEMGHTGSETFCCGEGGAAGFFSNELASRWPEKIKKETNGERIITYCAGCVNSLDKVTPASHIIDLIFEPEKTMDGTVKISKAPFTYLNRLKVKRELKKKAGTEVVSGRKSNKTDSGKNAGKIKKISLLLLVAILGAALKSSGITDDFNEENIRQFISGMGVLGPAVYILIYSVAPSLFVPGLPLTIAGGIIFGPFWGVIYTIIGSTTGASIAFLISRYLARDWVESKIRGTKLKKLDGVVEKNGWKVVAFTRLIPVFPFNLLNYAFGLTKIGFLHYVITSFVFMLPACVAFIVFSSSLPGLLSGVVSPKLLVGLLLIALVSMIPLLGRKIAGGADS